MCRSLLDMQVTSNVVTKAKVPGLTKKQNDSKRNIMERNKKA